MFSSEFILFCMVLFPPGMKNDLKNVNAWNIERVWLCKKHTLKLHILSAKSFHTVEFPQSADLIKNY